MTTMFSLTQVSNYQVILILSAERQPDLRVHYFQGIVLYFQSKYWAKIWFLRKKTDSSQSE